MKLYIEVKNSDGESHKVIISADKKVDCLKKAMKKLPKDFLKNKEIMPRVYISELGFDSEEHEYVDVVKVFKKIGFKIDE